MQGKAQSALKGTQVVPHDVGVVGDIGCFNMKALEALDALEVSVTLGSDASSFRASPILHVH